MSSESMHVSVVAPCWDEAESVERVVRAWDTLLGATTYASEIVICDDGSRDETPRILERLRAELPRLRVVTHARNSGYGRALATAIAASRGDVVVTLDSDGQFELADGLALVRKLEAEGLTCVSGRRRAKADSALRVVADRGLNGVVRVMFGVDLRDTNCALKAVRGDALRALTLDASGYSTPTEIVLRLAASGASVVEAPVHHVERAAGTSKLRPLATAFRMARYLVSLRARFGVERGGVVAGA